MFRTRLISGVILVAVALLVIIQGGVLLLAVSAALSLIGLFELYRAFQMQKSAIAAVGYCATIVFYLDLQFSFLPSVILLAMAMVIALMCVLVFSYPKVTIEQVAKGFFGVFYVTVMLSCIYLTRELRGGAYLVWLSFLCSWGCDTCAYCVGKLFGKHKMAPVLSPKKSVEGAVGGVVGAVILTIIYGVIFKDGMGVGWVYILIMGGISAIGALISMVGDLCASAIKRQCDIKDYGRIIPGHGGILDRFDSVIFTAPLIYFLCIYFLA